MFASHDTVIRLVSSEVAKEFGKAWEDLGLTVSTFTSDDKKAVLLLGYGDEPVLAAATLVDPSDFEKKPAKGGKA